eukprot:CAMPEP_0194445376 /NCGR_PEP_ID=MMETSP0176-20130528/127823_1 /TAXON_ID=216777 /ORGANISM="Proboscia alata, Strain PI-D3" /LENGTH=650 /DNA_ID=CAMNT_0039271921 /DNA_START=60 /DNA_END=2013 /DNA_ORIENTATION=-
MTENRIERLNKIGFEWTVKCKSEEDQWDKRYEELVSYVQKFGHARVPKRYPQNILLWSWVSAQRKYYERKQNGDLSTRITETQIELLNKVGFEWTVDDNTEDQSPVNDNTEDQSPVNGNTEDQWHKQYKDLASYVQEFGHAQVPKAERRFVNKDNETQIELLNKVGFEWSVDDNTEVQSPVNGNTEDQWHKQYKDLASYVQEFGHAQVPRKYPLNQSLANWVRAQRNSHRMFQNGDSSLRMTDKRIELLDKIGFEWTVIGSTEDQWHKRYKDLENYVQEFGHAQVPKKFHENQSLANWVRAQRNNHRMFQNGDSSSRMTDKRIELLNKIGFEWTVIGSTEDQWHKRYKDLENYVQEFGHAQVPKKFHENQSLANWVRAQRNNHRMFQNGDSSSRMTDKRIELLNKIGFEWKVTGTSQNQWYRRLEELVSYVKEFGNTRVPPYFPKYLSLGHWVYKQRVSYKRFQNSELSLITTKQIELLNKVGFEWNIICTLESRWNTRYEELLSYVQDFGHAQVSKSRNPPLAVWSQSQRVNYKKFQTGDFSSEITERKVGLLNLVGFEWKCSEYSWYRKYEDLLDFVIEFDHAHIPKIYPQNPQLALWASRQQKNYEKYELADPSPQITENQIGLLKKVGFEWDVSQDLVDFKISKAL